MHKVLKFLIMILFSFVETVNVVLIPSTLLQTICSNTYFQKVKPVIISLHDFVGSHFWHNAPAFSSSCNCRDTFAKKLCNTRKAVEETVGKNGALRVFKASSLGQNNASPKTFLCIFFISQIQVKLVAQCYKNGTKM